MLGLGNIKDVGVKVTIWIPSVQKFRRNFFAKSMQVAQTGNSLFDRHRPQSQNDFIGAEAVKAMRIG